MAYENAPGTGALFPNDRKTSDRHPDHTGSITVHRDLKAGEKVNLAAWVREGKKGKFLSLRMSDAPRGDAGIERKAKEISSGNDLRRPYDDQDMPPF